MDWVRLYASVPLACFRVAQAREYWETYPCPPPATVYGMLLSAIGQPDRHVHAGAELAVALLSRPERSVVLRTLWRIKSKNVPLGVGKNKRPDFQELLTDVRLSVWVRTGKAEKADQSLAACLGQALDKPQAIHRFGGLSLGESTHLLDELRLWRKTDPTQGQVLVTDEYGDLSLPVWPDHVGSKGTRWGQFHLREEALTEQPPDEAWTAVLPPENHQ